MRLWGSSCIIQVLSFLGFGKRFVQQSDDSWSSHQHPGIGIISSPYFLCGSSQVGKPMRVWCVCVWISHVPNDSKAMSTASEKCLIKVTHTQKYLQEPDRWGCVWSGPSGYTLGQKEATDFFRSQDMHCKTILHVQTIYGQYPSRGPLVLNPYKLPDCYSQISMIHPNHG